MGKNHREFLASLSDRHLAEEIKYGRLLAEGGRHPNLTKRELEEALAERDKRRSGR